ncbi:MAG TPA: extracellular solute-binding protein [Candidatus Limnocylindrales bacterium]
MHRLVTVMAAVTLAAGLTAACGKGGGGQGAGGKTKIVIATFGEFGYDDLYKEYMTANPNIEIVPRVTKAEDHHKSIAAHLATNQGSADIEAIEEGWIGQFKVNPDKFYNLLDLGANDVKSQWPDWKWKLSVARNGAQIGLGTDVGGLAMCYRSDLFAKAGLPTNRDEVSKLWPTWDGYIATGKKYAAANVPDSAFFDGPTVMYRAVLGQYDTGLYDTNDNVVVESNPAVRASFDKTVEAVKAGLSAKIEAWSPDWNAGFQKGRFATIACPSWMMAYIQEQAKDSAGKWDIAKIPGGTGNWGGSYLAIPKQSKVSKEAFALIKWLTSPEQQAKVFRKAGNFPSTSTLYDDPVITEFANPFFSNAPVGKIFSESVATMKAQYLGPKAGDINTAIINGLTRVEQGKQSSDEAWQQAVSEVKKLV